MARGGRPLSIPWNFFWGDTFPSDGGDRGVVMMLIIKVLDGETTIKGRQIMPLATSASTVEDLDPPLMMAVHLWRLRLPETFRAAAIKEYPGKLTDFVS